MISANYIHDFTVQVQLNTTDAGGSIEKTYSALAGSPFKGFIEPLSGSEILRNEKNEVDADYRLFCDPNISIAENDRIVWDGNTFEIFSVEILSSVKRAENHHQEIYLNLRK